MDKATRQVVLSSGRSWSRAAGPGQPHDEYKALRDTFLSQQPAGTNDWLFVPRTGTRYAAGTSVPLLATGYLPSNTGLYLPERAMRRPMPIDILATYVTGEDVLGQPFPLELVIAGLAASSQTDVLVVCANLLAAWEEKPLDVERDVQIAAVFRDPYHGHIIDAVRHGQALFSVQAILILAKLAVRFCPPRAPTDGSRLPSVPLWLLSIQDALGRDDPGVTGTIAGVTGDPRTIAALMRTQFLSTRPELGTLLAVFQLRWRDLPAQVEHRHRRRGNLEGMFKDATGVKLDDLLSVGIALWAAASQGLGPVLAIPQLSLSLSQRRIAAALRLFAASPAILRQEIEADEHALGAAWSFDALRHYPVVRLRGGGLLVLSRRLLLERIFGAIRYDVESGLRQVGRDRDASWAMAFWQSMCERDARLSLASVAPAAGLSKRLYVEEELKGAFGTGNKTADVAIDYPDAWVVCEVTTSKLSREAVIGGSIDALNRDLGRTIDAKARQLEATIVELERDESRLTGYRPSPRSRFVPVLVMAEGFPVNPITSLAIEGRLKKSGILQGPKIAPLHVIDRDELSMVEGLAEYRGASFEEVLARHEHAAFRRMSLSDWLLVEEHAQVERPSRLKEPYERAWEPVKRVLRTKDENGGPSRGPNQRA